MIITQGQGTYARLARACLGDRATCRARLPALALFVPMFVFPERTKPLKSAGVRLFFVEVGTALWLLITGLRYRASAEVS